MFKGSIVALITPFRDGAVDEPALQSLVDWHIAQRTHGIVPCGTTGESPTLNHEEHKRVISLCIEAASGRVPVIAGSGSNSTDEAVALTRFAEQAGADGALVVTPYYNKPTQQGLYEHFRVINDSVKNLPLIIYNIPGRSVVDMSVETMTRLFELPHIIGVKDATGDVARASQQRAAMGPGFCMISGNDGTTLGFMAHGGHGCISVTANVAPAACAAFQEACMAGRYEEALSWQDRLMDLHEGLFLEASPAPAKYGASLLELCSEEVRLPLVPIGDKTRTAVRRAMSRAGVLDG
ncbi:MAG: 4-hydroxy-tetrahydrodipicolinate synthase [Parvularculales bacterium]